MRGVTQAEIMTHRGQKYPVHGIVAEDPINDVILLSTGVPPEEIQSLTVDSSAQDPGDRVVVISRHKVFANALSEGTVSATTIHPWVGLRLAVPLTYGASGSPVFNSRGEVVAIIRGGDRQDDKIGYAIPAARLTALAMKDPYPLSQIAVVESPESKALGRIQLLVGGHPAVNRPSNAVFTTFALSLTSGRLLRRYVRLKFYL